MGEGATTPTQDRAMRNLWWDGFFAEATETIWLQYFSVYALALGAHIGVIGAMAAFGNLLAAMSMWPGAVIAERTRAYRLIVLVAGGVLNRLALLVLCVIPWIATGNGAIGLLILVAGLRGFLGNVAMPAWSAFAAEFIPPSLRGRYFASRNFARQVSGFAAAPLIGLLIFSLNGDGFAGWQAAWLAAFCLGMISTVFYWRIPKEAAVVPDETPQPAREGSLKAALRDQKLLWLVGTTSFFQLSVMIAGPFFSVYLVEKLGANALWVGITAAAMPFAGIIAQPILGRLNDRYGAKWLLVASGLCFPIAPWAWIVASEPWHIVFINLVAGVLWAANLLAVLNIVLEISPPDKRPTYMGMQQAGVFFASFIGPLAGGLLITSIGFRLVFFLSGAGRWLATLLLWRFVDDEGIADYPEQAEPVLVAGG